MSTMSLMLTDIRVLKVVCPVDPICTNFATNFQCYQATVAIASSISSSIVVSSVTPVEREIGVRDLEAAVMATLQAQGMSMPRLVSSSYTSPVISITNLGNVVSKHPGASSTSVRSGDSGFCLHSLTKIVCERTGNSLHIGALPPIAHLTNFVSK